MSAERPPYLVLDTNGAIALANEARFEITAQRWTLCAPRILWSECSTVLYRAERRTPAADAAIREAFDRILGAPIELIDDYDRGDPWGIADVLGWHKTYDAEYLAAARSRGAGLFTLDKQLRSGAERLGIELIVPD